MNELMTGVRGLQNLSFLDTHPQEESLRSYVLSGLAQPEKCIASKFLYDETGSDLFDQICMQPEYYQTDAELEILSKYGDAMLAGTGRTLLIELGSGHSRKIRCLLSRLGEAAAYVPIDISRDYLLAHAEKIANDFPAVNVAALCADFLSPLTLPVKSADFDNRIAFFPGSTIGNFEPPTQRRILANIVCALGQGGSLVIGVDKKNGRAVLEAAYNDAAGVTAAFELNILERINRELGADFDLSQFRFESFYNDKACRIEMYVVSRCAQNVTIDSQVFAFTAGERVHLENSYKFDAADFVALCALEGLTHQQTWTDAAKRFNVYKMVVG